MELQRLEVLLGNIIINDTWASQSVADLEKRATADDQATRDKTETIFTRLCRGLAEEGFDSTKIALFINTRMTTGTKLKYCAAREVEEVLN